MDGLTAMFWASLRGPVEVGLRARVVTALEAGRDFRARWSDGREGPPYGICALAAALLDDVALWRDVVSAEQSWQRFHYDLQRDSGMSRDDLGDKPHFYGSAGRVRGDAAGQKAQEKAQKQQLVALLARLDAWLAAEEPR